MRIYSIFKSYFQSWIIVTQRRSTQVGG